LKYNVNRKPQSALLIEIPQTTHEIGKDRAENR